MADRQPRARQPLALDYLVVGHVTRDILPGGGPAVGGTATYAARTAQAIGCRTGVITSAGADLELRAVLPGIRLLRIPAPVTTTFENRYSPSGREQLVHAVARGLSPSDVPPHWRQASVVHLGPVAQECDPALARAFGDAFLGLTPQGWMRRWDGQGRVHRAPWESAGQLLPHADAVVVSEEDLAGPEDEVMRWAARTPVLALTRGPRGCRVYAGGEMRDVAGYPAVEVDPTGAGDIFAATFFTSLAEGIDPWRSAQLANGLAAISIARTGSTSIPTPAEIARCRDKLRS